MREEHQCMPLIGEALPKLDVQTTQGPMSIPSDFQGSWFVLFSHPADFTPVCTTEFISFQHHMDQFRQLECKLIGLSVDSIYAHISWTQWMREKLDTRIDFPVIVADEDVTKALGMLHKGKLSTRPVRAVFIIDPEGIVRLTISYPKEVGRSVDEIIRAIQALQVSDRYGDTPENWPKNELIGDRVIVPPPDNTEAADHRLEQFEGFDWWFCHKKIS